MYSCSECGFQSPVSLVVCKDCSARNTFTYTQTEKTTSKTLPSAYKKGQQNKDFQRYLFNDSSLNELFWGGVVKGSVNFFSAEPGAGKSTFLGQLGLLLKDNLNIVYFSGEENESQVYSRMERLYGKESLDNVSVYYGDDVDIFIGIIDRDRPDIVILDSINSISGESYTRQADNMRMVTKALKTYNITGFIIGHINKAWEISGKKTLEHEVDGVFMISGQENRTDSIRILKALKLRFGPTDNVVVMRMWQRGFSIIEPSESFKIFVEESPNAPGSVFTPVLEWNQLFLLEVQSIITESSYSQPANVGIGINKQHLSIILATIAKVTQMKVFKEQDIFVKFLAPEDFSNVKVDLAVVMSLISSYLKKNLKQYIFIGIVWLAWEIRSVPRQEEIKKRLIKHGYKEENIITREKYKNIVELIREINKS